jgi:branched-chain amino acid transport system substrate-binding protein
MSLRNGWVVTGLAGAVVIAGCGGKKPADEAAAGTPGVTATEIKIGQTMPYSGPASAYAAIGKADVAYLKMINDKGGINGRKITLISLDDGYAAPKTVELTRKLVEDDGVAFIFNSLGTAANTAIQRYLNDKKIPQLFVATGADKWADPAKFPWTMGWQPRPRSTPATCSRRRRAPMSACCSRMTISARTTSPA